MSGLGDMQLAVRALKEEAMDYLVKGKHLISRLIQDVDKLIQNWIFKIEEDKFEHQNKLLKIMAVSLVGGILIAFVLIPMIFE